jgi:hypothetical protein
MGSIIIRWDRGGHALQVNMFFIFVLTFFFLNSAGLPHGLTYTTIFTPIFYVWLLKKREKWIIFKFLVFFSPFVAVHLVGGVVNHFAYARSFILLISVYITIRAGFASLRNISNLEKIFDKIIIINLILSVIALLLLKSPYIDLMWTVGRLTSGVQNIARLKLFNVEPSYYSTLLVPFIVYALTSFIYTPSKRSMGMLICVMIPLALSFSFGVISALVFAVFITIIFKNSSIIQKPFVFFIIFLAICYGLYFLSTNNLFTYRLHNFLSGIDSSGNNRIFESTDIGYKVAKSTNLFMGAGFGQVKFYLPDLFDIYWKGLEINRLTNTTADTLATLGIAGVLIRLIAEILLFFRTRVYTDFFRFVLFIFIFIYQFTGSYMTNLAEYVIWLFAFCPVFDRNKSLSLIRQNYENQKNSGIINGKSRLTQNKKTGVVVQRSQHELI